METNVGDLVAKSKESTSHSALLEIAFYAEVGRGKREKLSGELYSTAAIAGCLNSCLGATLRASVWKIKGLLHDRPVGVCLLCG